MNARVVILAVFIMCVFNTHANKLTTTSLNVDTDLKTQEVKQPSANAKNDARKKKRLSRKKQRKKVFTDMSYDELKVAYHKKLEEKDAYTAMKYLERMIKLCTDVAELANLMVSYADMLFDAGEFTKSGQLYTEFTRLYPGHEKTEYSLYRAILCYEYDQLAIDRDQSKTNETIELANEFLNNDVFTTYQQEVKKIRTNCYAKLIESDLNVCDFYLKKGSVKAVDNRLQTVKSDLLPHAPEAESLIVAFELRMAESKGEDVANLVAQKAGVPAQEITKVAHNAAPRKAADRF